MSTEKSYAHVAEGVRAAIGVYAQALDDGRTDDIVATFCADGACEFPGMGAHEGHAALRAAFAEWKPRQPQRHLVFNTVLTHWDDHEATAVSDMVFVVKGDSGWSIQVVGRYHDTLHCDDGTWRFHRRAATFVT